MQEQTKPNAAVLGIVAVALIGLLVLGVWIARKEDQTDSSMVTPTQTTAQTQQTESMAMMGGYQDGSYKAKGTYGTPGGQESVDVALTLADGKVTDVTVVGSGKGGESEEYQSKFISGYKQFVVGKSIDSVVLDRVAGSSLTADGFNDALESIKEQANAA